MNELKCFYLFYTISKKRFVKSDTFYVTSVSLHSAAQALLIWLMEANPTWESISIQEYEKPDGSDLLLSLKKNVKQKY